MYKLPHNFLCTVYCEQSHMIYSCLIFIFCIASAIPATAQSNHFQSFTFSPVHLSIPVLEVNMEIRLQDKIGVAAIFGLGDIEGIGVLEAGAQGNYYFVGDFQHGLQIGAEAMFTNFSLSNGSTSSKPDGKLFRIGPYAGYKYAADFGLTAVIQYGIAAGFGNSSLTTNNNSSVRLTGSDTFLNLNTGWSF